VTKQLRADWASDREDQDSLLGRLYSVGGAEKLEQLLADGLVDSAAQLTTAFHAFCTRLIELRTIEGMRRTYRDIFLAEEYDIMDVALETAAGKLFVSGTIDCLRMHPSGDIEIVDYKLSSGIELDKELIQLALYRALLLAGDPTLRVRGSLEYFLPELHVTNVSARELDSAFASVVAPMLTDLVACRQPTSRANPERVQSVTSQPHGTRISGEVQVEAVGGEGENRSEPDAVPKLLRLGKSAGILAGYIDLEADLLRRHCAVLGGTGSGKTTLALNILEQILERGIPVLLIDRKGDLARYADPAAWTAHETPERVERRAHLRSQLDIALFTPGHRSGRPLHLSLVPSVDGLNDADRNLVYHHAAHSIASMLHLKQSPTDEAKRAILLNAIKLLCEVRGRASVSDVARLLEGDDSGLRERLGALDKERPKLVMQLKSFETMNQELLADDGEPLDVERLLGINQHKITGRTRLSIISTRFFDGDAAALFWVAQLIGELNRFAARRPSAALQAVVMFDEADMYLPAMRQPATKAPMESLLKRGRSAGLGVMLATQSPGDLDYKCRDNVLIWLIGRIKEPRALEKLNPVAGAAGIDASVAFPKQGIGQFHLITEGTGRGFQSDRSLIGTEQLSEQQILDLARATSVPSVPRKL